MADTRKLLEELEKQLIDDQEALKIRNKLKNVQILDFSGNSEKNGFKSDDLTRILNDAPPTQEISDLFIFSCNQIIDLLLSESDSGWQNENISLVFSENKTEANKTQDTSKKLSDFSCVTFNKDGDMVLSGWLNDVLPRKSRKPILDMIKLQIEASFAAVFKSDGELNDELIHFLKRPPFSENDLDTAISDHGLLTVRTALMQAASLYLLTQSQNEQTTLGIQEMSSSPKVSQREQTLGATSSGEKRLNALQLVLNIVNNIVATVIPAYVEARFNILDKPAEAKTIDTVKKEYTKVKKDIEKMFLVELKKLQKSSSSKNQILLEANQISELNSLLKNNNINDLIEYIDNSRLEMPLLRQAAKNIQKLNELNINDTLENGSTNYVVQQFAENLHEFQSFLKIVSIQNECVSCQNHLGDLIEKELKNVLKTINKDLETSTDSTQSAYRKELQIQSNKLTKALTNNDIEQLLLLCKEHNDLEETIKSTEIRAKKFEGVDESQKELQLGFAQALKDTRAPQFIQNENLMLAVDNFNAVNSLIKSSNSSDIPSSKRLRTLKAILSQPDIQDVFSADSKTKKFLREMQITLDIPAQVPSPKAKGTSNLFPKQGGAPIPESGTKKLDTYFAKKK